MTLDEHDYVSTVWFASIEGQDWLCVLWKKHGEERWTCTYRFRYYASPDPFDQEDEKSWYQYSFAGTEAAAIEGVQLLAAKMHEAGYAKAECLPVHGGPREYMAVLKQQPWAHFEIREGDVNKPVTPTQRGGTA